MIRPTSLHSKWINPELMNQSIDTRCGTLTEAHRLLSSATHNRDGSGDWVIIAPKAGISSLPPETQNITRVVKIAPIPVSFKHRSSQVCKLHDIYRHSSNSPPFAGSKRNTALPKFTWLQWNVCCSTASTETFKLSEMAFCRASCFHYTLVHLNYGYSQHFGLFDAERHNAYCYEHCC